jgi:hypothetical protein
MAESPQPNSKSRIWDADDTVVGGCVDQADSGATPRRSRRLVVLASIVVVAVLTIAGIWLVRGYASFRHQLSTLGVLTLGDTRDEVAYKLGRPPVVYGEQKPGDWGIPVFYTDRKSDPINAMPEGTRIEQYQAWSYTGPAPNVHLDVDFNKKTGRVERIECFDLSDTASAYCPHLLGLAVGDSEARMVDVLGAPTSQKVENGVKTAEYSNLGVAFLLKMQRVYSVAVYDEAGSKDVTVRRCLQWLANR